MLPNVSRIPYGTIYQTNDQRQYEFPAQNLETDKIVHALKADLSAVTAALGLADFVLAADEGHAFAASLVKEAPMNKSISRIQADLVEDDTEVFERAIQTAADHGRLPKSVLEQAAVSITPPEPDSRNRIQDTQADEILVRNRAMSRQSMSMRGNLDYEAEDTQIKKEDKESPMPMAGNGDTRSHQSPMSGKETARGVPAGQEAGPKTSIQRTEESLQESSHDPAGRDKPTQAELNMSAVWITDEWLSNLKSEILALPHTAAPLDPASLGEYEPGVKGILLGVVDGQSVWAVDMRALAVKHSAPDVVVAGNSERWTWCPESVIFVDWSFTSVDRNADMCHECCEFVLMRDGKFSYSLAHKLANYFELAFLLEMRPELAALKPKE